MTDIQQSPNTHTTGALVSVSRYRQPDPIADWPAPLQRALAAFAGCAGYRDGVIVRNTDDHHLWALILTFESPATYRRALSSYDVKVHAVPTMYQALDEPAAYEMQHQHHGSHETSYESIFDVGGTREGRR